MYRLKSIIVKTLLFFITFFVMHDYLVGQNVISAADSVIKVENIKKSVHHNGSTCEVHQVFHSPALITDLTTTIYSISHSAPEQNEKIMPLKKEPFIPYTPPKNA